MRRRHRAPRAHRPRQRRSRSDAFPRTRRASVPPRSVRGRRRPSPSASPAPPYLSMSNFAFVLFFSALTPPATTAIAVATHDGKALHCAATNDGAASSESASIDRAATDPVLSAAFDPRAASVDAAVLDEKRMTCDPSLFPPAGVMGAHAHVGG